MFEILKKIYVFEIAEQLKMIGLCLFTGINLVKHNQFSIYFNNHAWKLRKLGQIFCSSSRESKLDKSKFYLLLKTVVFLHLVFTLSP